MVRVGEVRLSDPASLARYDELQRGVYTRWTSEGDRATARSGGSAAIRRGERYARPKWALMAGRFR
jgi:hypothetical protein